MNNKRADRSLFYLLQILSLRLTPPSLEVPAAPAKQNDLPTRASGTYNIGKLITNFKNSNEVIRDEMSTITNASAIT